MINCWERGEMGKDKVVIGLFVRDMRNKVI